MISSNQRHPSSLTSGKETCRVPTTRNLHGVDRSTMPASRWAPKVYHMMRNIYQRLCKFQRICTRLTFWRGQRQDEHQKVHCMICKIHWVKTLRKTRIIWYRCACTGQTCRRWLLSANSIFLKGHHFKFRYRPRSKLKNSVLELKLCHSVTIALHEFAVSGGVPRYYYHHTNKISWASQKQNSQFNHYWVHCDHPK